jgi:hypothetical protein
MALAVCGAFASLSMPAHSVLLGFGRLFLLGFSIIIALWDGLISPVPTPQPGAPGLHIYDFQDGPVIPPGTGYLF